LGKRRELREDGVEANVPCLARVEWQQESEEGNQSEKGAKAATKTHSKNCQEGAKRFEPRPKKVKIPMRKDEDEDAKRRGTPD
jgi:hypothetical protein